MRELLHNMLIHKSLQFGRLVVLSGTLVSCSSNQVRRMPQNFSKATEKRTMKLELIRLWAQMEYSRLMGDEVHASLLERDYELLEREMTKLELESETSLSSR